tara:strand:- start:1963 stop:2292 length:330 start_codon:yes stop_codon:yes gene_type:complete
MNTATILEAYGTLGATGMISLLFGFMITNLIKSQKHQDEELESIRENISKMNEVISNSQSIILKLVDKTQRVKESQENSDSRRFESLMKEIDDLSDKIAYITGRLNGKS